MMLVMTYGVKKYLSYDVIKYYSYDLMIRLIFTDIMHFYRCLQLFLQLFLLYLINANNPYISNIIFLLH